MRKLIKIKKMKKIFIKIVVAFLVLGIVSVIGAPFENVAPDISSIEIKNITDTNAEITFTVDQEDAKTIIRYGTTVSLGEDSDWDNDTGLTRSITLSGLNKNTNYRFRIYAYNGSDQNLSSRSSIRRFNTTDESPNIIAPNVSDIDVENITYSTANISFSVDQENASARIRYGTTESLDTWSNWNNEISFQRKIMLSDLSEEEKYYFSVYVYNKENHDYYSNSAIDFFETKNNTPNPTPTPTPVIETYGTGNRIWDESKDMDTNYIWNSFSFAGFYYDIDNNISTEELIIKWIRRTINRGNITYTTSPIEVDFEYSDFGEYQVIGFMADKYFAGYTGNSAISSNEEISVIGRGQLQKVLIDDEEKRTISEGGTITLKEGYVLKMREVDVGAGKGQVWISLLKDGDEIDNDVIEAGDNYIYSKRVGSVDNIPIIAIHFDTVFRGKETNAAFVKGVFQISESYTTIDSNSRYGKMEVSQINEDRIIMENKDTISLSSGETIDLMGNLKIIVADSSDVLRFALSVERTGTFEARGTVYPITDQWTPMNFGLNIGNRNVGFYYNLDEDIGTENLKIEDINGMSIPKGGLIYSTSPQDVNFDYSNFGEYQVIGFMADKYFAGYTEKSDISNHKEKSAIKNGQLHKIVLDDENKHTVSEGGTLTLKDGYVLKMKEVDIGAGKGQIWIILLKDGNEIDNDVIEADDAYIYSKKVGKVDDLPVIAIHFDSVFRGREANAAFIKGIFQISESYTTIDSNSRYGKMEISSVTSDKITMENKDTISLSSGNTVDVMGNIKFKVADSEDLRFYPFVLVTEDMITNQLLINAPSKAIAGDTISINVTAGGIAIEGVSIVIDPEIGAVNNTTNDKGVLNFTFPITSNGTYKIVATKNGYQGTNKTIGIEKADRKLNIEAPIDADQFGTINIRVVYDGKGISGVTIAVDNNTIGITDDNGTLTYKLESSGIHTISVSKEGYITTSREINIRAPYSEFKAKDINIIPNNTFINDKVYIISNITNVGTKSDTKSIELIVDNISVNNQSVTIAPNETKQINFTYKASIPEGNHTIEVLEQKELLEVKNAPINIVLIAAIITVIGAIVIYLFTIKDKNILQKIRK